MTRQIYRIHRFEQNFCLKKCGFRSVFNIFDTGGGGAPFVLRFFTGLRRGFALPYFFYIIRRPAGRRCTKTELVRSKSDLGATKAELDFRGGGPFLRNRELSFVSSRDAPGGHSRSVSISVKEGEILLVLKKELVGREFHVVHKCGHEWQGSLSLYG